ncbi:MAG TPA: hypothetical protein VHO03_17205 [Ignavibacteriales bacterium]|nr:hypothetical protein [Ignavibacteriales bacterium]
MKTGIELIAEERQRQIEKEGWTPEHDDQHEGDELAFAAACYSIPGKRRSMSLAGYRRGQTLLQCLWPFDLSWWKPTPENRVKELTKAGAFNAAEIDRLLRKIEREKKEQEAANG